MVRCDSRLTRCCGSIVMMYRNPAWSSRGAGWSVISVNVYGSQDLGGRQFIQDEEGGRELWMEDRYDGDEQVIVDARDGCNGLGPWRVSSGRSLIMRRGTIKIRTRSW